MMFNHQFLFLYTIFGFHTIFINSFFHGIPAWISSSTSSRLSSRSKSDGNGRSEGLSMMYDSKYLEKLVKMKQVEVENLLRRHTNDSIFLRMNYFSMDHHNNISVSLRKDAVGPEKLHKMGIMIDMKRNSPTIPNQRNIVEFPDAAKYAKLLTQLGADAIMINTEETLYGGKLAELEPCSQAMRRTKPYNPPACIAKDIFIHPIQIAVALENGASGVLLNARVLGATHLRSMLDASTFMGVDAIVEVHTPSELEMALAEGAMIFLVNMWDRESGRLFPKQAKQLSAFLPMNTIAAAAGDIRTLEQVAELGYYGFDSIVLGRNIVDIPDIKAFIDGVHGFTGRPRAVNLGMKSMLWEVL